MTVTLISAEQIVGTLIGAVLSQRGLQTLLAGPVGVPGAAPTAVGAAGGFAGFAGPLSALDIFVVQANTNTLVAHLVSLVAGLWLLARRSSCLVVRMLLCCLYVECAMQRRTSSLRSERRRREQTTPSYGGRVAPREECLCLPSPPFTSLHLY
jgi:hypothetical protein